MTNTIKVGDTVLWRGNFNTALPLEAEITAIELCDFPRYKYGKPVNEIPVDRLEYGVFSLSNGHWCYGEQIEPINKGSVMPLAQDYEYYYV